MCDQGCSNSVGNYTCSCVSGFRLDTNGKTCNGKRLKPSDPSVYRRRHGTKDVGWSNAPISPTVNVNVTKCLPEIRYNQNPSQTVLNGVLTPCDTLCRLCKEAWILLCSCIGHMEDEVFGCFSPVTDKLYIRNRDFRKHLLHLLKIDSRDEFWLLFLLLILFFCRHNNREYKQFDKSSFSSIKIVTRTYWNGPVPTCLWQPSAKASKRKRYGRA